MPPARRWRPARTPRPPPGFAFSSSWPKRELRLGDEAAALERFDEAYDLLTAPSRPVASLGSEATEVLFRIAVAWLRYAESRNCAGLHSPGACILPIRGDAVHRDREGSERAARYLREYLATVPPNSVQQIKARWLLNLAHMTLGDHPGAVEPEHRLPLSAFGSEAEFPRFANVAPELGLDTFNLSGGAVVDDFDGDVDLDIFTTTFDPAGSPRLFLNDGQGDFADASRGSGARRALRRPERRPGRRRQRRGPRSLSCSAAPGSGPTADTRTRCC